MEYDMMRAVLTVVMLLLFLGIVAWSYSGRQRQRFDAAAQLPLEDELAPPGSTVGPEERRP